MRGVITQIDGAKCYVLFDNGNIGQVPTPPGGEVGSVIRLTMNRKITALIIIAAVILFGCAVFAGFKALEPRFDAHHDDTRREMPQPRTPPGPPRIMPPGQRFRTPPIIPGKPGPDKETPRERQGKEGDSVVLISLLNPHTPPGTPSGLS
jgi:hypothetical protein